MQLEETILTGIVVGLVKLGMEEIKKKLQKKDNPGKPKKRKSSKKKLQKKADPGKPKKRKSSKKNS